MARPNTTTSKWSRHVHDSIYDIKRLKAYANFLTKKYGTGANLLKTDKNVRCKQTIVVASYKAEPYLFRTYSVEGQDPVASISDAICAAGAKRGFLYPCVLRLGDGPAMKFGDETFANCLTNATPVALDEVTRIYGEGARISAVVNIGRGPEQLPWEGVSPNDDLSEPLRQGPFWRKPKHKCPDRKTERIPLLKHHPPPTARPHRHLLSLIGRKPPDLAEIHQRLKAQRASDHTKIVNQINSIDSGAKYTRLGPDDASRDFVINDVLGLWDDPARLALDEEIKAVAAYLDDREVINTIENLAEVLSR
ncbi:MAG: hypothetical protein M1840_006945 [Geoglossum simile]|nr:MAG: hypothetical protein M1840_006945 [Geoglossum simile]